MQLVDFEAVAFSCLSPGDLGGLKVSGEFKNRWNDTLRFEVN